MSFSEYLSKNQKFTNEILEEFLKDLKYPNAIADGMRYAVLNGGKRIRPILFYMTLELFSLKKEDYPHIPVAIEVIHSYSLVHDDLPALDNDDYRRGKLTTHKKFGHAQGILIGDALLTYAFYILSNIKNIPSEITLKIINFVSDYAGINGMIGGQEIDIESENKKIDIKTLEYIHKNKTGKLLTLPILCGIMITNPKKSEKDALLEYAELIGLAFQIKDDILDIEGNFDEIGKLVGSDEKLDKSTYPSIYGLEESKKMLADIVERASNIMIKNFGEKKSENFVKLATYIASRKK